MKPRDAARGPLRTTIRDYGPVLALITTAAVLAARCLSEEAPIEMEVLNLRRGLLLWADHSNAPRFPQPQLLSLVPRLIALPARLSQHRLWHEAQAASSSHILPSDWRDVGLFSATWGREIITAVLAARKLLAVLWCGSGVVLWFALRSWGYGPALVAVTLWMLSPSMLSFGFRAQSDGPAAIAAMLACLVFRAYVRRPRTALAAAAGVALGIALHVKLSMIFLAPVWVTVAVLKRPQDHPQGRGMWTRLKNTLVGLVIAYLTLWMLAFDLTTAAEEGATIGRSVVGKWISRLSGSLLPAGYAEGLAVQLAFLEQIGRPVRVWGTVYPEGTPWYYIGTILLKEPAGTVASLCLTAASSILLSLMRPHRLDPLEMLPFWLTAGYIVLAASLGTGYADYRYILPGLACAYAVVGWTAAVAPTVIRRSIYSLTALGTLEALSWSPFFMAFVSIVGGSPSHAYRLVDPIAVCRGQDLPRLARWFRHNPWHSPLAVVTFNNPLPAEAYGIRTAPVPMARNHELAGERENEVQRWVAAEIVFLQHVPVAFWAGSRPVSSQVGIPALWQAEKVAEISPVLAVYKIRPMHQNAPLSEPAQ